MPTRSSAATDEVAVESLNDVQLRGRLSIDPVRRVLPSGDEIVALRLLVARPDGRSDSLDATAWTAQLRRRVRAWSAGDVVEVEGAVRRRFWRTPGGPASRWDIEISGGRRLRRA